MISERAVVLLSALIMFGVSLTHGISCEQGLSSGNPANSDCNPVAPFCGKTETTTDAGTVSDSTCQADLAACDGLCAGVAGCVSACCNTADCNTDNVATIRSMVTCMTGSVTTGTLTATTPCGMNELCARTETTVGGTTTTVGSCQTQAACDSLCSGVANCASACCNDADTCNGQTVAQMNNVVRCGTGVLDGTFPTPMTCTADKLCGRIEVANGDTTGSCSTQAECDSLCSNTDNCVSACCSNADDCNTRTVAQINAALRCGTGIEAAGAFPTATTCAAGEFCARKEINSGDTVGSCETQASCELLCSGVASCTSACCNDGDFCNSLAVTDILDVVRCATGSVMDGTLTGIRVCASTEKCRRRETTAGNTVTTVGECLADATSCDDSCTSPACVSACCTNDLCNTLTVAVQTGRVCMVGTTTTVGTNDPTGSMVATHCSPNTFCGRTETTTTANSVDTVVVVGSCQATVTSCELLCVGVAGCVAACCNDADNCNSDSVMNIKNIVRCGDGTLSTEGVFPRPTMLCQATEQCGRTETTTNGETVVVGSCTAASACAGLCGTNENCVSACCNNADTCNTLTVAMQNSPICMVGTTTTVGNNAATGSMVATHCSPNMFCGRTQTTTTADSVDTVVVVGSCQASVETCDLLCVGVTGCVAACCNNADACNSDTVTDIIGTVTCGVGTFANGAFPTPAMPCTSTQQCGRTETTTEGNTVVVGSCTAAADCGGLCDNNDGCVSACCNNADTCNTLTVAVQNDRICMVGTTTTVGNNAATGSLVATHCSPNMFCGRTETTTTADNVDTVVVVGSCQASADSCDLLCADDSNCVRACCNDADGCNSVSVAMMTSMLTCYTGTVAGTTLTETTACTTANHVCARTEATTGTGDSATVETIGSCQAQTACATLCDSIQNCVSACCSSSDLCNSLTVSQQTARNCYVGTSTSDTPVMDMTYTRCAASEQCGRTQTSVTSGSTTTVTTVGSCTAASACDTLCGTAANCVSTCCDTDGCNSAAIPTTTTTTTTTAATTTTGGAEHAAQINMLVMMGLVVLGWFMA